MPAGELVLLLHWSTLNVTGLSKILKKHDKVSKGHVQLRALYLANALQQVPLAVLLHSTMGGKHTMKPSQGATSCTTHAASSNNNPAEGIRS
jgi:SPX domain